MLQLRDYQERSLDTLGAYLRLAAQQTAKVAFIQMTERPYREAPGLTDMPYVCLRVPTGGGKTFMACHALGIVAQEYLQVERVACLWLVPSNAIREQTLAALRDRRHPYRQALDAAFGGNITVMDLSEALYVQRGTLDGDTVIVVTTLQSLRVEDTDGRKVYETAGTLQHHFDGIPPMMEAVLETESGGRLIYSLANVLRMRRPVVIMDEAHNARTKLSFETLTRFYPSCIVEFTATPQTSHRPEREEFASNVLHHVSARELKEAQMVKLPIKLRTRDDWREIVGEALNTERHLRKLAEEEEQETGEHIRPIVLFQAQSIKGHDISVGVLKDALINHFKIPAEQIAIATGTTREIDGVDLFAQDCPIRYIITVKALVEGWDCSFAYILCSVSEISTPRSVEQLLGRILRLPHAKRKQREGLNCAYAFAASANFMRTAQLLRDALIEGAGFQRMEASDFVEAEDTGYLWPPGTLFGPSTAPPAEPAERPVPFSVPLLGIRVEGQLELFDDSHLLPADWSIAACDASLSQADFPSEVTVAEEGEIDMAADGRVRISSFVRELHQQLSFVGFEPGWTVPSFVNWLDRQIDHPAIPQSQSSLFIHKIVTSLMESRGVSLEQLARDKFRLAKAIDFKMEAERRARAAQGYQQMLLAPDEAELEVSPELCLTYDEDHYAPSAYYEGPLQFAKHVFASIGDMNSEEAQCAARIDAMEEVEAWVRNLERRDSSFSLPTSTDRFYPDFVVMLKDGRILVLEYKGADRWSNDDSKEKRAVGELWEDRSKGQCLFLMPKGMDWAAIENKVKG